MAYFNSIGSAPKGSNKMAHNCSDINISSSSKESNEEDASQYSATDTAAKNFILYTEACYNEGKTKCTIQSSFFNASIEDVLNHVARSNNALHYLTFIDTNTQEPAILNASKLRGS